MEQEKQGIYMVSTWLSKSSLQNDLAVLPGVVLIPGGTRQCARYHPLYARKQGKVPKGYRQKHLSESESWWLPEFTHREYQGNQMCLSISRICPIPVKDTTSPEPSPKVSQHGNKCKAPSSLGPLTTSWMIKSMTILTQAEGAILQVWVILKSNQVIGRK